MSTIWIGTPRPDVQGRLADLAADYRERKIVERAETLKRVKVRKFKTKNGYCRN